MLAEAGTDEALYKIESMKKAETVLPFLASNNCNIGVNWGDPAFFFFRIRPQKDESQSNDALSVPCGRFVIVNHQNHQVMGGGDEPAVARSEDVDSADAWEITDAGGGSVHIKTFNGKYLAHGNLPYHGQDGTPGSRHLILVESKERAVEWRIHRVGKTDLEKAAEHLKVTGPLFRIDSMSPIAVHHGSNEGLRLESEGIRINTHWGLGAFTFFKLIAI